ncbi:2-dehydropantoate 2-reductase [Clavibacter michiganensis subsp. michiganensis]|nr:2-dehydropantoate 2-reductase [Clavibacter michiganensis subsp. michiganensis]
MTPALPAVAVVGPGAIGTSVAAALHEAGVPVLLCGRTARDRLVLVADDATVVVPGPVRTDPAGISAPVDLVLLAVKATQVEAAAPWLRALCHAGTVVVVLQNGIEQVGDIAPHVPGCPVVPAVVWFPAEARADGSVLLRGDPRITLPDVPASRVAEDALAGGRCRVELAADFRTVAWRKLVQNAVAGIMAATGRRAGVFRRDDVAGLARGTRASASQWPGPRAPISTTGWPTGSSTTSARPPPTRAPRSSPTGRRVGRSSGRRATA